MVRPCSGGSPICLSRVCLQSELDDTKSSYQLIIKFTVSEKRRRAKRRGKLFNVALKERKPQFRGLYTVSMVIETNNKRQK